VDVAATTAHVTTAAAAAGITTAAAAANAALHVLLALTGTILVATEIALHLVLLLLLVLVVVAEGEATTALGERQTVRLHLVGAAAAGSTIARVAMAAALLQEPQPPAAVADMAAAAAGPAAVASTAAAALLLLLLLLLEVNRLAVADMGMRGGTGGVLRMGVTEGVVMGMGMLGVVGVRRGVPALATEMAVAQRGMGRMIGPALHGN
jgi:hypothetical protein